MNMMNLRNSCSQDPVRNRSLDLFAVAFCFYYYLESGAAAG